MLVGLRIPVVVEGFVEFSFARGATRQSLSLLLAQISPGTPSQTDPLGLHQRVYRLD